VKKRFFLIPFSILSIFLYCNLSAGAEGENVFVDGNVHYYLDDDGRILFAKVYEGGQLKFIQEYYADATVENARNRIKEIFELDGNEWIIRSSELDGKTQKVIRYYEFYPSARYGEQDGKIKYRFDLDASGYVSRAAKMEEGTGRVISRYEYYLRAAYGKHGKKIKYRFDLDASGYVDKAVKMEEGTGRITNRYEYYPKTVYGNHGKNIRYTFAISSGYVQSAAKFEQGTGRILASYSYLPNTVYGKHGTRISKRVMNVPAINQLPELPTGCEITAVAMMLQYKGVPVDKIKLAKEMPRHSWNPDLGYVGDPFTERGWTVYPPALMNLVKKYAQSAKNLTGAADGTVEKQLASLRPVVVRVSPMHGFNVHALVLTGYDAKYFYFNDPWTGKKNQKISKAEFYKIWKNQKRRALSY